MKRLLQSLPKILKNFYFVVAAFFLTWMFFFDSNDLITQSQLGSKKAELEAAKSFYEEKIDEVQQDRQALLTDEALLEKIAREKYLMKKENEDIFIIVEE